MSLRTRLVCSVLGLLALGLVIAMGATFGALQDWKGQQNDDVLGAAGRELTAQLRGGASAAEFAEAAEQGAVWRRLAADGDVPALFELRDRDGALVRSVGSGAPPRLPDPLGARFLPAPRGGQNPDGERFVDAATARSGGEPNWLVRTSRLGEDILVVGMRTVRTDELLSRTRNVVLISGAAAMLVLALVSWRVIRRGMRPLDDIAATAGEIGSGELSRRVPQAPRHTEIGTLAAALNAMLGQLESAFAEREASEARLRRFVGDASHELRTPIATIRGYAELFRRGAASRPEDLAKILDRIESEAARVGVLVDELLLLARLDAGRPLHREPVELTELAADAVADAVVTEPDRDVRLVRDGSVTVTGDADRLRQVLGNLLGNALRHTPPETLTRVSVRAEDGRAVIEVADDGPGMTERERTQVFERFYRGDVSRGSAHGGAGLGLSIVAAVVAAHDGEVSVHSAPGEGTTFRVLLPIETDSAAADSDRSTKVGT